MIYSKLVTTALISMCETTSEIISILPKTDLVLDLHETTMSQWRILSDIVEGNDFFEEDLNYLIEKSNKYTKTIEEFKHGRKLDKKN